MSILQNSNAISAPAGGGDFYSHQIASSLRNSQAQNGTLKITAGTPTSRKTFTYSWWWKRYNISSTGTQSSNVFCAGTGGGTYVFLPFTNGSTPQANFNFTGGNFGDSRLTTNMLFRDTSGWYHHVLRFDSTQAASSNRVRLYVNGVEPTYSSASVQTDLAQNEDVSFMNQSGVQQGWGGLSGKGTGAEGCDVQMAEIVFNDGQSYGPDSYGETKNGVWIPKDPSGLTFGNNGYWLKMASGAIGTDSSGNGNNFTVANIAAHDVMLDSPTFNSDSNGGNFATYNPLMKGSYTDLSEGNCRADSNTSADASYPSGNFQMLSGKWYYEQLIGNLTNSYPSTGIVAPGDYGYDLTRGIFWSMRLRSDTGVAQKNSDNIQQFGTITVNTTGVASVGTGDIVSWYIDMDNKKAWFAKNGTIPNSGDPANGTNPQFAWTENPTNGVTFMSQEYQSSFTVVNAGADGTFSGEKTAQGNSDDTGYGNFYYNPPTGFLAMCTGNIPLADAINPALTSDNYPQKLFSPKLYTGNGGTNNITGLGFKPDWLLIKIRNTASNAVTVDSNRGTNKVLFPTNNDAEATSANLTAFGTDGFSLAGGLDSYDPNFNGNNNTYVAWAWRANGGTTSSNGNGSITSTVQVCPSGGFSIVTWTGVAGAWGTLGTVGHGLSAAPTVIFAKTRGSGEWCCFFNDYGVASIGGSNAASNKLQLDVHSALYTNQSYADFGKVMPTSTVFTVNGNLINNSGTTVVAYCFSSTEGYIKSGVYKGNGSTDGTFVWCGFRPSMVITKMIDGGAEWAVYDDKRDTYNVSEHLLQLDIHDAERTDLDEIDILSNGFKCRSNGGRTNQSSKNYVFLAFASNPFSFATAR